MPHYIVEVSGYITAESGTHYAQSFVTYSTLDSYKETEYGYSYDKKTHTVKGNLVLSENKRAIPYAIYVAHGPIYLKENTNAEIGAYPGVDAAYEVYKENILKINTLLNKEWDEDISGIIGNALYIEVFSTLELFLSDFILCKIYNNNNIFNQAVKFYQAKETEKNNKECDEHKKSKSQSNKILDVKEIEYRVHKFFFDGVVYHKFNKVKSIFKEVLSIECPDTEALESLLHKRNNIVHRASLSNIDRMTIRTTTKDEIKNLIDVTNTFVTNLMS